MRSRVTLDEAESRAVRLLFGSWWLLATPYTFAVLYEVIRHRAPVATRLGIAPGPGALLFDLVVLIGVPLGVLITVHRRRLAKRRMVQKLRLLGAHDPAELLTFVYNPQLIYLRLGTDADGQIRMRAVWNANGPVGDPTEHTGPPDAFRPFDGKAFLAL